MKQQALKFNLSNFVIGLIICLILTLVILSGTVQLNRAKAASADPLRAKGDTQASLPQRSIASGRTGIFYFETAPTGGYFQKFDVVSDVITGYEIHRDTDRGWDTYGVIKSGNVVWSTQGASRFESLGEVQKIAYVGPTLNYTYSDAWGITGIESTSLTDYRGHVYESFFDGNADDWTDDGSGTWSIPYVRDPGNYIDNRVYQTTGLGEVGWRGSYYDYSYSASEGFTASVDVRRWGAPEYNIALAFLSDGAVYQNEYLLTVSYWSDYSLWKMENGSYTWLIPYTYTPATNTGIGEWNNLKVSVLDGTISLYINDQYLNSAVDTTFTEGKVGVLGYDPYGYESVQFDNATIHRDTTKVVPVESLSLKSGRSQGKPEAVPERP